MELTQELKKIRTRDDLVAHAPKFEELFQKLTEVIVKAQDFKDSHPKAQLLSFTQNEQAANEKLRIELNRILRIEGGKEVIEQAQLDALKRL